MTMKTSGALRFRKRELFRMLRYEPHEGQILVHRSRASRRVLSCGSRFGKSTCGVMETMSALLAPGDATLGWIVCPTYQLTERIFKKVLALLNEHFAHRIIEFNPRERRLVIMNLGGGVSELRAMSSDRSESLLGESLTFLVVDECASVRDDVWNSFLAPRLIDRNGWALLLSTPSGRGWFHEQWKRGQKGRDPDYESWQAPTIRNPHIKPALIEAERARLTADQFAGQYEAQFVGPPEPCDVCGGPSKDVMGHVLLFDDEPLRECPECGEAVDANGKTLVALWPDGRPHLSVMYVHTPGLTRDEIGNLQQFNAPGLPV